ncbi:MAG: hypothetical protein HYZ40_10265, partial [Rhodospirillales bacterium]|nr:hypothetical protein [Rhodospirillales bacterium]
EKIRHEVLTRLAAEAAGPPPEPPAPPPVPKPPGFGKKLFDFFNSSVGMWLLSSVVLTGGAAMLQNIQHQHEVDMKNRETISAHNFELINRIDHMQHALYRAKTAGDAKAAMDGMFKSKFPLTPELQNKSLGSLHLTVIQLLPDSDPQKTTKAMNFIRQLEDAELSLQSEPDDKPLSKGEKEQARRRV